MSWKRFERARSQQKLEAKRALAEGDMPEPHKNRRRRREDALLKIKERRRERRENNRIEEDS